MADRKRKNAAITGIRKKRMLNLDFHELPEDFFQMPANIPLTATGGTKQYRKNQGGARRKRQGGSGTGGSSSSTEQTGSAAVVTSLTEDGPIDLSSSAAQSDDFNDHVLDPVDHETAPRHDAVSEPGSNLNSDNEHASGTDSETEEGDYELEAYAEAVNTNVAGFYPVCANLFVVQGWNTSRNHTTMSWFHLRFQSLGSGELSMACTCPRAAYNDCIHIRYFDQYRIEEQALGDKDSPAVIFSQRIVPGLGLHSLFSVQSNSVVELRGRAIVSQEGPNISNSVWKCSKDTGADSCYHIKQAKALLPDDFGRAVAEALALGGGAAMLKGTNVGTEPRGPGQTISHLPIHPPHWARLPNDPCLYKPLPEFRVPGPNTVLKLDSDSTCADEGRTRFDPTGAVMTKKCKLYTLLNVYAIAVEVQPCPKCPSEKQRYIGPDLRTVGIFNYNNHVLVSHELLDEYTSCYTSSETPVGSYVKTIDRRYKKEGSRFMGEDLFRAVWFSYAHLQRLTDDMTCATCGPAPKTVIFDGITLGFGRKHVTDTLRPPTTPSDYSLVRRNLDYTRQQQLLPDALLRRRLRAALDGPDFDSLVEDLEERMGRLSASPLKSSIVPSEEQVDSFHNPLSTPAITRSFLQYTSLCSQSPSTPSTPSKKPGEAVLFAPLSQPNFAIHSISHPIPVAPALSESGALLNDDPFGPSLPVPSTEAATAPLTNAPATAPASATSSPSKSTIKQGKKVLTDEEWKSRQRQLVRDHLALIDWVRDGLVKQGGTGCPELAALFDHYFGQVAYAAKGRYPKRVLKIWKNLFTQIAAEESVIQMVNYKSWEQLSQYLGNPTVANSSMLVHIPAFYKAITCDGCDVPALNSVLRWVETKTRTVLSALITKASPPMPLGDPATLPNDADWRKTGCYYSMPAIRHRPLYPKLDDSEKKSAKDGPRGDRCGKYYSEYGEKRLTGGIMVCWCQHSVCYGFHTIPASEGRNDVFSALVTRWPTAPERVIYDFACALGPYCMTREPQFFGNTSFMIDHFHAAGHTKCSPAAFLAEYENTDPQLSAVNSSAAECGNGALRRIRKSVSYMSQERAVIYTKVFLSIWNRTRALAKGAKARDSMKHNVAGRKKTKA